MAISIARATAADVRLARQIDASARRTGADPFRQLRVVLIHGSQMAVVLLGDRLAGLVCLSNLTAQEQSEFRGGPRSGHLIDLAPWFLELVELRRGARV